MSTDHSVAALAHPVPPPGSGLGSNSNYILCSNCNPLINLSVEIDVTQDVVWQSSSGSLTGFGFQLNGYSPTNETSAWQQYIIALFGTDLQGWVDNWPLSGTNIINKRVDLVSLSKTAIPAGYKLQISLSNDQNRNIAAATYLVLDNQGNIAGKQTQVLSALGVSPDDLAPLVAFELNLVGPGNGESVVLSSGAGTITYAASTPLTVLSAEPQCAESGYVTAETANSFYGEMPAGPSATLTQSFTVTTETAMIRKVGKLRPSTHKKWK